MSNGPHRYPMAALIRLTLITLYLALVLPLPLLAPGDLRVWMALAVPAGLVLVLAITSERVELDEQGLRVGHPPWCSWWLRRGWSLSWEAISGLTPVATSQGGRVFYVRSQGAAAPSGLRRSYLLPQRVAGFEDFLERFSSASGIDTSAVGRITPPWTYQMLALLSGLLLAGEVGLFALNPVLPGGG
ncbi:MAG: hypothetical protein WAM11_10110 [Cyanobium sp.]